MTDSFSPAGPGVVPARYGRAITLAAGQILKVLSLHGTQVVDFWAFAAADLTEALSMEHTRSVISRISPVTGDILVSTHRRPMLLLAEDTSPGIHDTQLCACNRYLYEQLGCTEYHRNCEDNLHEALADIGQAVPCTPAPFNLFMNVAVNADRTLSRREPEARPGDYVRLRAAMDVIVAMSACPQDMTVINGGRTPRDVRYLIED
jgi:uncharacterized protein YcgI (DUF1989 family)